MDQKMNEIELRFYNSFYRMCNSGYIAQSLSNTIRVEFRPINTINYDDDYTKEKNYDFDFDLEIATYCNNILEYKGTDVISFASQYYIDNGYSVDFLLKKYVPAINLAIEIDGHEWHEKTKEQATRDKERERYLLKRGYNVIRFSGSEVYTKPDECAKEALNIFACLYDNILCATPESFYAYIAKEKML